MKRPEFLEGNSLTRLLQGAAAGVVITCIVGFGWGGWTLQSTAQKAQAAAVEEAYVVAYTDVCKERYRSDPSPAIRAAFVKESEWSRDRVIEKAGYATPKGLTAPISAVAEKCASQLSEELKKPGKEAAKS